MRRRTLVLAIAAAAFGVAALIAVLAVWTATNTDWGLERVRRVVMAQVAGSVRGRLHIGRVTGSLLGDLQVDSVEIRGLDDSLFLATGPVRVTYDVRDLIDRRIVLRTLEIARPRVRIHEIRGGRWNWKDIFPPSRRRAPVSPTAGFGDFVVVDSLVVRDGHLLFIQPWTPPAGPSAPVRDSLLRAARRVHELRLDGDGRWEKLYRWENANVALSWARLAHPDSAGQAFQVAAASLVETEPAFFVRNARGLVRKHDDTVWVDLPELSLAASQGTAKGVVWWGGNKPQQWDVRIRGDSACMSDYGWIYPTLPRTGCGRTNVWIHNDPRDLQTMLYELTEFDLSSVRSRVVGRMTYGVGPGLLQVRDVDLAAQPVDFDLLRVFKGGPFPYDFQGTLEGRVRGRGGPVDRFVVDAMDLTYRDRHVPGAVSRVRGKGTLDIEYPGEAVFKGFDLDAERVDLRTIRYVNPSFPELNGIVRGRARLDSLWYDVRFRDADLEHVDGDGPPTRLAGRGRMMVGDVSTRFDVQLMALPMSFAMLARSYPSIPVRIPMSGPLTIVGTSDSLGMTAAFTSPSGALTFRGVADVYADSLDPRRGFDGTWTFDSLDVRRLLADTLLPTTRIAGEVQGALASDTLLPTLEGALRVRLDRGSVDGVRLFGGAAQVAFRDSVMQVDSLRVETSAAIVTAQGRLGLGPTRRDSMRVAMVVDTLGGLRQYLATAPDAADTLAGSLSVDAVLSGNLTSLDIGLRADGGGLVRNGLRARRALVNARVRDATGSAALDVTLRLDTVAAGGLSFVQATAEARSRADGLVDFAVSAEARTGPALRASGTVLRHGDTTDVTLERGTLVVADEAWALAHAARAIAVGGRVSVDSVVLRGPDSAEVAGGGTWADTGVLGLSARLTHVPLATLARLAGTDLGLAGRLDATWSASGTRTAPRMAWRVALATGTTARPFRLESDGSYRDRVATTSLLLRDAGTPIVRGGVTLPLDLAFEGGRTRRIPGASLTGVLTADGFDLGVAEAFTPMLARASGRVAMDLALSGTWDAPRVTGRASVADGATELPALGRVSLRGIQADLRFTGDTVRLATLEARSVSRPAKRELRLERVGKLDAAGTIAFRDLDNPVFDLRLSLDRFNAVAKPRLADIDLTGTVQLSGPASGATLVGAMEVTRGSLVIPDVGQSKQLVDPNDPDFLRVLDTALFAEDRLLPSRPSRLVSNLVVKDVRISMGPDVWLRSAEANINLGGSVAVARRRAVRGADTSEAVLSLDGTLLVNRGTYRLNIGNVVQRTFDVEQGKIAFSPVDPNFDPGLDISAVHTVRKFNSTIAQQDRRIRVRIGGTLREPTLAFESADNAQLSQSDLISYLITGAPAFGVGDPTQSAGAVSTAANVLLTSLSSALADQLAQLGYLDYVQIQTAGLDRGLQQAGAPVDPAQQILSLTRIGGGVQLSDRIFLSGDAGLCPFVQQQNASLWTQFGVRLEYRVSSAITLSGGVEPPTQSLLCGAANVRGFVLTPQQIGLDLTAAWRF
jgi:translocation and assembly module TamB